MSFKTPSDLTTNRNGQVLNIPIDVLPIGMHEQDTNPFAPLPGSGKKLFPDGSAPNVGGTINKNGEYGPVTYGF